MFIPSISLYWKVFTFTYMILTESAFIKHSDSSEINCYHVRMDLEVMRGHSLETTIILDT